MPSAHTNHCISTIALWLGLAALELGCGAPAKPEATTTEATTPQAATPEATEAEAAQPAAAADPEQLERIWNSGGEGKWEAWDQLRQIYADREETDKLFAGTERAVREGSPYWADYLNHGGALVLKDQVSEAVAVYDAGLALAPDVYLLLTAKGSALWMLDQRAPALAAYQRALAVAKEDQNQQEMHSVLAVLVHEEQGLDDARPHYQALTAETVARATENACAVAADMAASPGQPVPIMYKFLRNLFVRQSAGVAAYKLQTSDADGARQVLSKLIGCGIPRKELNGLFGLAELINKSNMKL
jgi:tetratricopeptide (TPR) repeat protein